MNTCKNCGAPLYSHATVCIKCLTPIPQAPQPKQEEASTPTPAPQAVKEQPKLVNASQTSCMCNNKHRDIGKLAFVAMIVIGALFVAAIAVEIFRATEFYDTIKMALNSDDHPYFYIEEHPNKSYEYLTIFAHLLPTIATILCATFFGYMTLVYHKQKRSTLCGYGSISLSAYFGLASLSTLFTTLIPIYCLSEKEGSSLLWRGTNSIGEFHAIGTQGFRFSTLLLFIVGLVILLHAFKKRKWAGLTIVGFIGFILAVNALMISFLSDIPHLEDDIEEHPIAVFFFVWPEHLCDDNLDFCKEYCITSIISMVVLYATYIFAIFTVYWHHREPELEAKQ